MAADSAPGFPGGAGGGASKASFFSRIIWFSLAALEERPLLMIRSPAWLLAAVAALAACEPDAATTQSRTAPTEVAGKAEAGTLSIDAPGFDMKLKIPESIRSEIGGDNDIIYPGATVGGMHLAANADTGGGSGSVELRFTSADAVEKVAAWYRDPARAAELAVASAKREGAAVVIAGTTAGGREADPFSLRLTPAPGGGTEGVLTLSDRSG